MNNVTIGINSSIRQYCVIGAYSMIGGNTFVGNCVLPCMVYSNRVHLNGSHTHVNTIGLQRNNYTYVQIMELIKWYNNKFDYMIHNLKQNIDKQYIKIAIGKYYIFNA